MWIRWFTAQIQLNIHSLRPHLYVLTPKLGVNFFSAAYLLRYKGVACQICWRETQWIKFNIIFLLLMAKTEKLSQTKTTLWKLIFSFIFLIWWLTILVRGESTKRNLSLSFYISTPQFLCLTADFDIKATRLANIYHKPGHIAFSLMQWNQSFIKKINRLILRFLIWRQKRLKRFNHLHRRDMARNHGD